MCRPVEGCRLRNIRRNSSKRPGRGRVTPKASGVTALSSRCNSAGQSCCQEGSQTRGRSRRSAGGARSRAMARGGSGKPVELRHRVACGEPLGSPHATYRCSEGAPRAFEAAPSPGQGFSPEGPWPGATFAGPLPGRRVPPERAISPPVRRTWESVPGPARALDQGHSTVNSPLGALTISRAPGKVSIPPRALIGPSAAEGDSPAEYFRPEQSFGQPGTNTGE
jgi:hypothetical protein